MTSPSPAPTGTVTLLFTDVEGSTRAWEAHPAEMQAALARHDVIVREVIEAAGGHVFKTVGDAFCAAFSDAAVGVEAAVTAQRALVAEPWPEATPIRVRMGLHAGVCEERDGDYFGQPVNRVARLEATAHGGQVVLSGAAVALVGDRLPAGVILRDLGEHRLKDLGRPERIFEARIEGLSQDHPPLRSLNNPQMATNLPEQVSSFIGRERQLDEVRALLDTSRLVTLTGPGGSGKSRLALQVAADLLDGTGDGVWLVDLAPLADGELVPDAVARVLGVPVDAGRPTLETLLDALRERTVLLLLDNCEHLVDAVAKLADALLRACPDLVLLATSREPMGIGGEHTYRVPSLVLPNADETNLDAVVRSEAVMLFAERAAQHKPGFTIDAASASGVARLVRRLDGIPLALELAAARLRSLSLEDLEQRLDQRFRLLTGGARTALPRQQTLGALVDWSYDLLNPTEQRVLARLSVFAGGWDLAAAEVVAAGDDVEDWEVLDQLTALVDKSLVQADDTAGGAVRYRLLETIRDYASAKLEALGEAEGWAVRTVHRDHYLDLAELACPHLTGHGQLEWAERLDDERDNLRAALQQCLVDPDVQPGLRLVVALRPYWVTRAYARETRETVSALLGRPDAQEPTVLRGWALATLIEQQGSVGDHGGVFELTDEALAIGEAHDADALLAFLHWRIAIVRIRQGEYREGVRLAEEGLRRARASEVGFLMAGLLNTVGNATNALGEPEQAESYFEEARDLAIEVGDESVLAAALNNLALALLATGRAAEARVALTQVLDIARRHRNPAVVTLSSMNLALMEIIDGHPATAYPYARGSVTGARRGGDAPMTAYALLACALSVEDPVLATTLHASAARLLKDQDETFELLEAQLRDAHLERLRGELGADAFEAADAAGRALSVEDAVALLPEVTAP